MHYPLTLRFKLLSLASQIYVTEPGDRVVFYVKQKMFKLKEAITVFADEDQQTERFTIKADRVIDFSATYRFQDAHGRPFGAVRRKGMRSLWKAHYEILDASDQLAMTLSEEKPWIKLLDGLIGEIPFIGAISGYVLNPTYLVSRTDGTPVLRLRKTPSLFERRFEIDKLGDVPEPDEHRALLGTLMMVLLERDRG